MTPWKNDSSGNGLTNRTRAVKKSISTKVVCHSLVPPPLKIPPPSLTHARPHKEITDPDLDPWTILGIHMCIYASCQCADYARVLCRCRWGARSTFYIHGIATMAPLCHHPRPPSPSPKNSVIRTSIWVEHIWVCHIWPIPMVCNDIPCDIPECDSPCTYARRYVLCENRSRFRVSR